MLLLPFPGQPRAHAQSQLTVNSTLDEPDATPGDGLCQSTPSGVCTLRAAVQEIDAGGTINVPAGLYVLSIPAGPEGSVGDPVDPTRGDLDISQEVTIIGAGADKTIIDGNNDHRIFDIHSGGGFAHIHNVTLRNGLADLDGATGHIHGALIHNHGQLELTDSTLSGGQAIAGAPWGGGALTNASNGTATLSNDTISGNSTTYFGGGIENGGTLTLQYVTLVGNTAPTNQGGGISSGAGFFAASPLQATLGDTIVAANTGGNCWGGTVTSAGYNLEDTATCPFINTGDQFGVNPMLSPVNNSQGSIFVYALQAGSPAIDKANPTFCLPTDERGVTRPQEGDGVPPALCDIGAYEFAPPTVMCDGLPATIVGTSGNDTIVGTTGADVIAGLGGNDTIYGKGGNDHICGGDGKDTIIGGSGNDRLFGGAGNDTLKGGDGNDYLDGGGGTDKCVGGTGTNTKAHCES
jgi:CSLREA domain-containing protein